MMVEEMTFGKKLAMKRKEHGFSQEKFASLTECSERSVQYYEAGEKVPSWTWVVSAAQALGVSLDWLAGLSDQG